MKIKVREIPKSGLELSQKIEPAEIGLSDTEFQYVAPLKVKGEVKKVAGTVLADVEVVTKLSYVCSRCLETFEKEDRKEFHFDYAVDSAMDDEIDLGDDIRQELILEFPVRVLCKEDCQGICAKCGANLNKEKCKCKK